MSSLWRQILDETRQVEREVNDKKVVLVLGNPGTGKSTLIASLQTKKNVIQSSAGLRYTYLTIQDENRDELKNLSVWLHDDVPTHVNLLPFALNESNFEHTTVVIVLSMAEPWCWPQQLKFWLRTLEVHIESMQLQPALLEAAKQRLAAKWLAYDEEAGRPTSTPKKQANSSAYFDKSLLAKLGSVLELNNGLQIIVAVTKTDEMKKLTWDFDYRDAHFVFMQKWLRTQCLSIGAALVYTSAKTHTNCDVLFKYLVQCVYSQSQVAACAPQVVQNDLIFVPAGWDTQGKITILDEELSEYQRRCPYSTFVQAPTVKSTASAASPKTVDEQARFSQQRKKLATLASPPAAAARNSVPSAESPIPLEQYFKDLMEKKPAKLKLRTATMAASAEQQQQQQEQRQEPPSNESIAETLKRLSK